MLKSVIYTVVVVAVAALLFGLFQGQIVGAFVNSQVKPRPELLANASEDDPATAKEFYRQFPDGTEESKLLAWLSSEKFDVHQSADSAVAKRHVVDSKCGQDLKVYWFRDEQNKIFNVRAYGGKALCF